LAVLGVSVPQNSKLPRAAPFDKTLIAVIGVLSAVQYESSIVGWMNAGGLRPNAAEMARVAALVGEFVEHEDIQPTEAVPTSKRSSDSLSDDEQRSPKRPCLEPSKVEETAAEKVGEEVLEGADLGTGAPNMVEAGLGSSTPTSHTPTVEIPDDIPPHVQGQGQGQDELIPATTKPAPRKPKRHRNKNKPFFPVTHPLSADDTYPFFAGGNGETGSKLWFQERDVYTYWVRRGLLALQECGIEPEDGVEG